MGVDLLGAIIGCDPGITDVSLRSAWEEISWVKSLIADALQTALPHLQNIPPLSLFKRYNV